FHGHQIPDFILNALENTALTINGTEETTTALLYVSDAVDGLLRLMQSPQGTGAVNIGSDTELKMGDVARQIITLAESTSPVTFDAQVEHLTLLGLPNLAKAREQLSWVALVRLEDGLQKTIDYIRANKALLTNGG
ncbi:MAG: NAD-dependent epimerase/dehydratase family protein, partial [Candidatus Uhrbacteria bacterium]|nr:NAD-dependent epimerase/dehydratase family protein [Candidatus Uhrbacteria bacterium]